MKKSILFGCLSSLVISQSTFAAHGAFYIGANGSRNAWHITQQISVNSSIFTNPAVVNQDWGQKSTVMSGELLGGIKASNGSVFGAVEGWYNPNSVEINSVGSNISSNTTISNQWGGRILAGVQHKEMTIYGIAGLGLMNLKRNASFTTDGIYNVPSGDPGPHLVSTNGSGKQVSSSFGIGMSVVCTKDWDISVEYQHQTADVSNDLYDSVITHLGAVGRQTTLVTTDTLNVGLKFHFRPFVF